MLPLGETKSLEDGSASPRYIIGSLGKNRMEEKGCKGLSKGNWPALQKIDLRKNMSTKVGTNWDKREYVTSSKQNGETLNKLN